MFYPIHSIYLIPIFDYPRGSYNNQMRKGRGGGPKMSDTVHIQGKTVHTGGVGQGCIKGRHSDIRYSEQVLAFCPNPDLKKEKVNPNLNFSGQVFPNLRLRDCSGQVPKHLICSRQVFPNLRDCFGQKNQRFFFF